MAQGREKVHSSKKGRFGYELIGQGGASNFPTEEADSSDEQAKIRFSGYYKCQKPPKTSLFTFQ